MAASVDLQTRRRRSSAANASPCACAGTIRRSRRRRQHADETAGPRCRPGRAAHRHRVRTVLDAVLDADNRPRPPALQPRRGPGAVLALERDETTTSRRRPRRRERTAAAHSVRSRPSGAARAPAAAERAELRAANRPPIAPRRRPRSQTPARPQDASRVPSPIAAHVPLQEGADDVGDQHQAGIGTPAGRSPPALVALRPADAAQTPRRRRGAEQRHDPKEIRPGYETNASRRT